MIGPTDATEFVLRVLASWGGEFVSVEVLTSSGEALRVRGRLSAGTFADEQSRTYVRRHTFYLGRGLGSSFSIDEGLRAARWLLYPSSLELDLGDGVTMRISEER